MGIIRSYDPVVMQHAVEMVDCNVGIDCDAWLRDTKNIMYHDTKTNDIGLATYEYPGCYNLHWFFTSRGRAAMAMAHKMLTMFFDIVDVKVIRGLTPVDNRAACWLARQIGCISYGTVECLTGPHELFIMTKEDYMDRKH